jgi:hypothetical protein
MSETTKKRIVVAWFLFIGFFMGYYFPRAHYTLQERPGELRFCAVQWNGSKACSAPLDGFVPVLP